MQDFGGGVYMLCVVLRSNRTVKSSVSAEDILTRHMHAVFRVLKISRVMQLPSDGRPVEIPSEGRQTGGLGLIQSEVTIGPRRF